MDHAGAAEHRPCPAADLRPREVLPLRAHEFHHPGQGGAEDHRPVSRDPASQAGARPARTAAHADLGAPGARTARLHRPARSLRGLDLLEPIVVDRQGHDHDRDDRRHHQIGPGGRHRSTHLASGLARALRADYGRPPRRADYGRLRRPEPAPLLRAGHRRMR